MDDHTRWRRPDPPRSGPVRNWNGLYRPWDSWDLREADSHASAAGDESRAGSWNEVVAYGVDLGYRVIEEQIRQGRRVAEQLNRRSYDTGALSDDVREAADRMWGYYADLGTVWIDFLGSLAGAGRRRPGGAMPAAARPAAATAPVSVGVVSTRPTDVTFELVPGAERGELRCHPPYAVEAGKPPLTGVTIERATDGRVTILVRVPDTQPPGIYSGTIVERGTGEPRGTLCVRIGA